MAEANALDKLKAHLKQNKQIWGALAQAGVWSVGLFSGFVLSPPADELTQASSYKLACFVAAFVVGLSFVAGRAYRFYGPKYLTAWLWATVFFLVSAVVIYIGYNYRLGHWTRVYYDHRKVIGIQLTKEAEENRLRLEKQVGIRISLEDVPRYAEGDPRLCYEAAEIDSRQTWLLIWFLGTEIFLLAAVLALIQAVTCANLPASGVDSPENALSPADQGATHDR